jgi:hypothetical protein
MKINVKGSNRNSIKKIANLCRITSVILLGQNGIQNKKCYLLKDESKTKRYILATQKLRTFKE